MVAKGAGKGNPTVAEQAWRRALLYALPLVALLEGIPLLTMTLNAPLLRWLRRPAPSAAALCLAGAAVAYLLMPLVHHLLRTDGYFYITDSDNFFATSAWLQGALWLTVGVGVWGLARLRVKPSKPIDI